MQDMLKAKSDEDQRKREEAQIYSLQQQVDELRRQLKENLARQQWFEELYRQGEGKIAQLQMDQDKLTQDVAQTLHARQVDEGRMKAQITEIAQRIESPDKQIRELRSQLQEVGNAIKAEREASNTNRETTEDLQRQLREVNSSVSLMGDGQRQLRDIVQELDSAIGEVRNEALHVAELQRMEEQRLRRQGIELQELFEALRQQFNEVAARSQRVDDVRRQLIERIEAVEEQLTLLRHGEHHINEEIDRVEKQSNEQYLTQQERLETTRLQLEAQLGEMRQVGDQRTERFMNRFTSIDERLRSIEQIASDLPSRFEALERRDEKIGAEAEAIEEWVVSRQLTALENMLDEVRKRREERVGTLGFKGEAKDAKVPGSVYNPAGLIKSVKDAKPPMRSTKEDSTTGSDEI